MYNNDSFFTLTFAGQVGLVVLSLCLTILALVACYKLSRQRMWWTSIVIAALIFFIFIWLAPQVYYFYYVFLLNVPLQVVVQAPPTPSDLVRTLFFQENQNLSYHAQGLLGWLLLFVGLTRR